MTALHLLAKAMKLHYHIDSKMGSMHCDNERAIGRASFCRRRIPPSSKHGDPLRLLRNIKSVLAEAFTYHGHADRTK
jgi:hypothetical protein